jgi:shikimate kinase
VLVGFMGAGKSSVGRALAEALGWRFVDFDEAIEEREGRAIAEIFEHSGEEYFRALEDETAGDLLNQTRVVLGSGGGWAARPGRLDELPDGTLSVWLRVGWREALRRAKLQPGRRPLIAGTDPSEEVRMLLERREPMYAAADLGVDTEGYSVEDVTARIRKSIAEHGIETDAE